MRPPSARLRIAQRPHDAPLVCAWGFPAIDRLTEGRAVTWYGMAVSLGEGYFAEAIEIGEITRFDPQSRPAGRGLVLRPGCWARTISTNIVGAAALLLETCGAYRGVAALQSGVASFRGVERRLDKKTRRSVVPAYEGFGSSYEKARSAIEAVLLHFPGRPTVVVFEPHTFSWRERGGACLVRQRVRRRLAGAVSCRRRFTERRRTSSARLTSPRGSAARARRGDAGGGWRGVPSAISPRHSRARRSYCCCRPVR